MPSFGSDNHSGVHERILQALIRTNVGHAPSYGTDDITEQAQTLLRDTFGGDPDPYFVFNGTAANVLAIGSLIDSYHSILCSDMAHLYLDECGAPEFHIGCKVIPVKTENGKITLHNLNEHLTRLGDQHFSQPKIVSITQPTEVGTVYSLDELRALREWTRQHHMYLHIDGARFIYAAHFLGVSLRELTACAQADAISFGGTKNGLLFGETVLLFHPKAKENFKFRRKQALQLPSKMRFVASQFIELLQPVGGQEPLWQEVARHGSVMANYLKQKIEKFSEIQIAYPVEANAVFVQIPKNWTKPLREKCFFYVWDENLWQMRWMMSFDITLAQIDEFVQEIEKLRGTYGQN